MTDRELVDQAIDALHALAMRFEPTTEIGRRVTAALDATEALGAQFGSLAVGPVAEPDRLEVTTRPLSELGTMRSWNSV